MKTFAIHIVAALISRDALHTYCGAAAVYGIWWGLDQVHRPSAVIAVSALFLFGIVYARTRR